MKILDSRPEVYGKVCAGFTVESAEFEYPPCIVELCKRKNDDLLLQRGIAVHLFQVDQACVEWMGKYRLHRFRRETQFTGLDPSRYRQPQFPHRTVGKADDTRHIDKAFQFVFTGIPRMIGDPAEGGSNSASRTSQFKPTSRR